MFNPLIGSLNDISLEDLVKKINELHTKRLQANSWGKYELANHILSTLNVYQEEYKKFPLWKGVDEESIRKSMNRALGAKGASKDYIPGRYNVGDAKKAAE